MLLNCPQSSRRHRNYSGGAWSLNSISQILSIHLFILFYVMKIFMLQIVEKSEMRWPIKRNWNKHEIKLSWCNSKYHIAHMLKDLRTITKVFYPDIQLSRRELIKNYQSRRTVGLLDCETPLIDLSLPNWRSTQAYELLLTGGVMCSRGDFSLEGRHNVNWLNFVLKHTIKKTYDGRQNILCQFCRCWLSKF
jgi:hypothetical protein